MNHWCSLSDASSVSNSKGRRCSRSLGRFCLTGRAMMPGTKDLLLDTIANTPNSKKEQ